MRQITLTIGSFLIIAALIALPVAYAQGGITPTPAPAGGFGPLVVGLPFSDTFDTSNDWIASGAWQRDLLAAYDGSGWFVDGSQRGLVSTLELRAMLDLSGSLTPQLMFRQKGYLPTSDLVTVDLSLDGGRSWFLANMQTGVNTDWTLYTISLAQYRGQVVRLRFRVETGAAVPPDQPPAGTFHLDNVTIQFVMDPPPVVEQTADRTLLGLHLIMNTPEQPLLDFVRRMRDSGLPVGTIKGTTGTENLLQQIRQISPETVLVFRSLLVGGYSSRDRDCPDGSKPAIEEAKHWMDGQWPSWNGVTADYFELMNECAMLPPDWLVPFTIEAMRLANERGICLLVLNFGTGAPEVGDYARYAPVYQYALQNPCQGGKYHGIALHAYGVEETRLVSESGPYLGLRHRLYYDILLPLVPDATRLPVYITEAGPGDGSGNFTCQDIVRDAIQYTGQLEQDTYIKGWHLWTLGAGIPGMWTDVAPCLPMLADALIQYYSGG